MRLFCCLALLALSPIAPAQEPTPRSIEDLVAALKAAQLQRQAAQDAEAKAKADLLAAWKTLSETVNALIGPTPPNPGPGPKPPVPNPPSDLAAKLKAAFVADAGTKAQAQTLAALWSAAAGMAKQKGLSGAYKFASSLQLIEAVNDLTKDPAWIGPDALKGVRATIAAEIAAVLGTPSDTPFTDAQRIAAADLFAKFATILEGL